MGKKKRTRWVSPAEAVRHYLLAGERSRRDALRRMGRVPITEEVEEKPADQGGPPPLVLYRGSSRVALGEQEFILKSEEQRQVLHGLAEAQGETVASRILLKRHGARAGRIIKSMPEALRSLLEHVDGYEGGHRLTRRVVWRDPPPAR